MRATSAALKQAVANGLMDAGVDVIDIGTVGTEEIYFATFHLGVDGGIEVTASHNLINYNGMKLVKAGSQPISGDTGLFRHQAHCFKQTPLVQSSIAANCNKKASSPITLITRLATLNLKTSSH